MAGATVESFVHEGELELPTGCGSRRGGCGGHDRALRALGARGALPLAAQQRDPAEGGDVPLPHALRGSGLRGDSRCARAHRGRVAGRRRLAPARQRRTAWLRAKRSLPGADGLGFGHVEPRAEKPTQAMQQAQPREHVRGALRVPDGVSVLMGSPNGARRSVGITVSKFNGEITTRLLDGALPLSSRQGGASRDRRHAGAGRLRAPLAAMALAKKRRYACVIPLGCVIRGETPHFEYISAEAASGLQPAAARGGGRPRLLRRAHLRDAGAGLRPLGRGSGATRAPTRPARRSRWPTSSRASAPASAARPAVARAFRGRRYTALRCRRSAHLWHGDPRSDTTEATPWWLRKALQPEPPARRILVNGVAVEVHVCARCLKSGKAVQKALELARAALAGIEASRPRIDDLNVYPVPTGTRGRTWPRRCAAIVDALEADETAGVASARAALMGARGNSGVILSQLVRGAARGAREADQVDTRRSRALRRRERRRLPAVRTAGRGDDPDGDPRSRRGGRGLAASNAPRPSCAGGDRRRGRGGARADAGTARRLREAGVVDAGGAGLVEIVRGIAAAVGANRSPRPAEVAERFRRGRPPGALALPLLHDVLRGRARGSTRPSRGGARGSATRSSSSATGSREGSRAHRRAGAARALGTALARLGGDRDRRTCTSRPGAGAPGASAGRQAAREVVAVARGEGNRRCSRASAPSSSRAAGP